MKKLLALILSLTLSAPLSLAESSALDCSHPFADLTDHWGENSICELYELGVVSGYSEKTFSPNTEMTRAEFVKILVESLGYHVYAVQSAAFTDLHPQDWYYAVVSFARSKGFISGYSDGSFHPNAPITRAEAVELLMNASGHSSADTTNLNHQFYDVTAEDWFAPALALALENDIVQGYGDGSFRPNNPISRAEACEILVNALTTVLN
ncbi:S-layer homology domain-containing protein [Candidatus Peregrinibacteria bacterium]|nr:MAG: S-layer homology domain-containing protein [Candidatus Peregrinibacteria bacterium]